jgi:beta-lactamase class A
LAPLLVGLVLAAGAGLALAGGVAQARSWPPDPYPRSAAVEEARRFAAEAPGTVAFAVIDAGAGLRGLDQDRRYSSASVSKALLLAAELRRLRGEGLDAETRALLESMIRFSDNDAAGSIYARVGDGGMAEVAERAGMRGFEPIPGYWGGAQVTAANLARFFFRLERALPRRHRRFGERLLATITTTQRWGIPAAAPARWTVYFKGGWRPSATEETSGPVTHQAALLRDRSGRRLGLAILTDLSPGGSSYEVLEGITERLLAEPPEATAWVAP